MLIKMLQMGKIQEEKSFADILGIIRAHQDRKNASVNIEHLLARWEIGGYLSSKMENEGWGQATIDCLVDYIHTNAPEERGYGRRNLYNMVAVYEAFSTPDFLELVKRFEERNGQTVTAHFAYSSVSQTALGHFCQMPQLFEASTFTNLVEIISRTRTAQERLSYIVYANRERMNAKKLRELLACREANATSLKNISGSAGFLKGELGNLSVREDEAQLTFWNFLDEGGPAVAANYVEFPQTSPITPRRSGSADVAQQAAMDVGVETIAVPHIDFGDSLDAISSWASPTVIVSDGPYGLSSYPGDPATPEGLAEWYKPHLKAWYEAALPSCTLWFWNSEQGWANCHRMIEECGWEFRNCHIWDKGMTHVAGNVNTKTIRKYPVVTEVCVQYVRKNMLSSAGKKLPLKDWLRAEWERTGLSFRETNVACGVRDAATRKYFSKDHLWYFPPADAFARIADYANDRGKPSGRPYFAKPDGTPFRHKEWELMRAKFRCEVGVTNVWHEPPVRGGERLKGERGVLHMNQKPLALLELAIRASSDPGDVVWEPFGGLCSATIAAMRLGRRAFAAEINPLFYRLATERIQNEEKRLPII
jgi:site-specific DNA-methyltransferase (adenine-specific)